MLSLFIGIVILFFATTIFVEFDKMQIPFYVVVVTPISRKVGLATIGVCVFVRLLR